MRRLTMVLVVAAMGAIAVPAGGAVAADKKFPTALTFDYFCGNGFCQNVAGLPVGDDWLFLGQVESPKRSCRADREVVVYEKLGGGELKKMGSDRSDSRGTWLVRRPNYTTTTSVWFAKAEKKKLSRNKSCKQARSSEIAD